jgi:hypothetical protein
MIEINDDFGLNPPFGKAKSRMAPPRRKRRARRRRRPQSDSFAPAEVSSWRRHEPRDAPMPQNDPALMPFNPGGLAARVAALPWPDIHARLDADGWAATGPLLTPAECGTLAALYADPSPDRFRKRVAMAQHGYGRGEYKYFAYPLPGAVAGLRAALYPRLAPLARRWHAALGRDSGFPPTAADYLARCHAAGQTRATPLLLRYAAGDYNRLHQDLYGDLAFPMQAVFLLSRPDADFTGGEFLLVEQRARMQSRAEVVPLRQGEAVIFAVNERPMAGKRGPFRVRMRHGVSRVRSGERLTLGIIFHDAR